jgi:predicted dehydrogenase
MANTRELGLGVIGCGGFGLFAMQHFMQVQGINLTGIAGTHREAAYAAAKRFNSRIYESIDELINDPGTDIVYIATPPFLHYEQGMLALNAGKHVICEKPLAVNMKQADEMIKTSREKNLLLVTNLMQKYNPIYWKVKRLIEEAPLGEPLHAFFENYACDEGLREEHWFWDKSKSGGIFIEHGVHFFDMFEGWFGRGEVKAAQAVKRQSGIEDQVQCTLKYRNDILVNYYHGFTQAGRMDRQELKILFERGDISLYEWIPIRAKVNAIADEEDTKKLMDIFWGGRLNITSYYAGKERSVRARHKDLDIYQMLEINYGDENKKMHFYGDLVRSMFEDQVKWIMDKNHKRIITEENGYNSLKMAVEAGRLAHNN